MRERNGQSEPRGANFEEAIAHHRLQLHTELKKTTSLPSAMFDASDPMLEARLCEATESIFRCLLELDIPDDSSEPGEQRLEGVSPAELHELLTSTAAETADSEAPALDDGLAREFAVILADTCSRGYGLASKHAAALLRRDSSSMLHDLDKLTRDVASRISGDAPVTDQANFEALCHRVATAILHSVYSESSAAEEEHPTGQDGPPEDRR